MRSHQQRRPGHGWDAGIMLPLRCAQWCPGASGQVPAGRALGATEGPARARAAGRAAPPPARWGPHCAGAARPGPGRGGASAEWRPSRQAPRPRRARGGEYRMPGECRRRPLRADSAPRGHGTGTQRPQPNLAQKLAIQNAPFASSSSQTKDLDNAAFTKHLAVAARGAACIATPW